MQVLCIIIQICFLQNVTSITSVKQTLNKFSALLFKIMQRCDDNIYYNTLNSFDLDDSNSRRI